MRDQRKTKAQLVGELHEARRRIAELEDSVGLLDLSEAPGGSRAGAAHVELGRQLDIGFRRLVEQLPAISYTAALDEASTTLYISPQVEPLLGCTQEEYAADPDLWLRLVHPEDRERVLADVARCHETGEPLVTEYRMVTGDGRIVCFRDQAVIVRDETGAGGVLLGVMTDITELKRAEEALRESEEQLRAVFESSHDLLSLTDDGGRALLANSAWRGVLGYMPQEEEHSRDRTHPDDRARVLEAWEAFARDDSPITDLVHRYQTAGGDYVFLETTARKVTVGGRWCCFVSSRNVTARVRAEEALRDSEEKYRRLFDGLNDAAFVADTQTCVILEANARAETLLGRTREEIVGMHQTELHPPAEAARYREKFASHAAKGRVAEQDADVLRKDGTVVPVAISAATMTLHGRHLMIGIFRDITEQRRLEREFLNLSASIQRRIGQDLHQSLGQVLTGIAFHAKGLERKLAVGDRQAAENAARVRQLANDAISQARSLAQGLCPVELGADGLMSALEEHAAVVQELFGIPCGFRCDHPVLIEDHDRATQLYYIAREATNNAVRHAAPRSITVALRADDGMISVVVRDDGKGLLPDWEESGGMGVRTMRYRAAMIGGTLDLHSHEDGGTTVTCVLDTHANSNGGGVDHEGKGASEAVRESREGPDR